MKIVFKMPTKNVRKVLNSTKFGNMEVTVGVCSCERQAGLKILSMNV